VNRFAPRALYDVDTIHRILDAGVLGHIGFIFEATPVAIPTLYWREGNHVYWHGSRASRMLRAIEHREICLSVTHLDGIVLARSAFHHSANYRSAMLFGRAIPVEGDIEVERRLQEFMESLAPGRWSQLRPLTRRELRATRVLGMEIDECSAKIRTGSVGDPLADASWPVWAGIIPIVTCQRPAQRDPTAAAVSAPIPEVSKYREAGAA
jgi:hypothetical protein